MSAGEVLPTSRSLPDRNDSFVGVQLCSSRLASGESSSTLSPQVEDPSNGPLPVATRIRPLPGSITAPARPQIALSPRVLVTPQELAAISRWRFEHSLFQTCPIRPLARSIVTT